MFYDAETLSGALNYTDPNYDFLGNSIKLFCVSSTENDKPDLGYENTIIAASVGTSFEQYKDITNEIWSLNASYDDLQTEGFCIIFKKKQTGTFSELAANYGFSFDKRDRAFMPTSGSIISFGQSLPIYADKQAIANTFSASKYKSFSDDVVGSKNLFKLQ